MLTLYLCVRLYRYERSVVCFLSENYFTVNQCVQSVVFTHAHVFTRVVLRTSLSYDDVASNCCLSSENLHSQSFGMRLSTVFGTTNSFFVCHFILRFFGL